MNAEELADFLVRRERVTRDAAVSVLALCRYSLDGSVAELQRSYPTDVLRETELLLRRAGHDNSYLFLTPDARDAFLGALGFTGPIDRAVALSIVGEPALSIFGARRLVRELHLGASRAFGRAAFVAFVNEHLHGGRLPATDLLLALERVVSECNGTWGSTSRSEDARTALDRLRARGDRWYLKSRALELWWEITGCDPCSADLNRASVGPAGSRPLE